MKKKILIRKRLKKAKKAYKFIMFLKYSPVLIKNFLKEKGIV